MDDRNTRIRRVRSVGVSNSQRTREKTNERNIFSSGIEPLFDSKDRKETSAQSSIVTGENVGYGSGGRVVVNRKRDILEAVEGDVGE